MEHYDIVIIGAGPAGSTLARCLSTNRGRVLIVDKRNLAQPERNTAKPCSGLVAVPAQAVLKQQGLTIPSEVKVTPSELGVRVVDTRTKRLILEKDRIVNVDRWKFECWLFSLIPGWIEVSCNTKLLEFNVTEQGVELKLQNPSGQSTVFTKQLVGADGANSKVRKAIAHATSINKYTGVEWFVPITDAEPEPFFNIILDSTLTDYYLWSVPKEGYLHIGGAFSGLTNPKVIPRQLEEHLQELGVLPKHYKVEKMWAHPISRAATVEDICFGNDSEIHLIGEASGLICPTSAEGYSYALNSAMNLGDRISLKSPRFTLNDRSRLSSKLFRKRIIYNDFIRASFFTFRGSKYGAEDRLNAFQIVE